MFRGVSLVGVLSLATITVAAAQSPTAPTTQTSFPRVIRIAGTLPMPVGAASPIATITFAIYADETGGTPLWQGTQTVIVDSTGAYNALLGSTAPDGLPLEIFTTNDARWLSLHLEGATAPDSPRVLIASVAYALRAADADTLGGRPASAYVLADPSMGAPPASASTTPSTTVGTAPTSTTKAGTSMTKAGTNASVSGATMGTPGHLGVFTDSVDLGDSVVVQSGARIGIGTVSPVDYLHVQFTDPYGAFTGVAVQNLSATANAVSGMLFYDQNGVLGQFQGWNNMSHAYAINNIGKTAGVYDGSIHFLIGGASALFVAPTGNIGLGTMTPTLGRLQVAVTSGTAVYGTNGFSTIGTAVNGTSFYAYGVQGSSNSSIGVFGSSVTSNGVAGTSRDTYGVQGTSTNGSGVYGTGAFYGVIGDSPNIGVEGNNTGDGYGVAGSSTSGIGVSGQSSSGFGMQGVSDSTYGVYGIGNFAAGVRGDSNGGWGIYGTTTTGTAVYGSSDGSGVGVTAQSKSGDLVAGLNGSNTQVSHIANNGTYTAGSDFAEALPAQGDRAGYEPADVLVVSADVPGHVELAQRPYDPRVAGIYSTRPGVLGAEKGGTSRVDPDDVPVAIVGIVPTKISAENGPVGVGDLLTTSGTAGYAMRCAGVETCFGAIVGKALEPLAEGMGVIRVLVMLR